MAFILPKVEEKPVEAGTEEERILLELLKITKLKVLPLEAKTFRNVFIYPFRRIVDLDGYLGELKILAFKQNNKDWTLSVNIDGRYFLEQVDFDELKELTRFSKVITAIEDAGEYYVAIEDITFTKSIMITIHTKRPMTFPLIRYEIVYTKG